jgi:hypothetical protein
MATSVSDVLTPEDIQDLTQLPEVLAAREQLDATGIVKFSVPITETIRAALRVRLGLDLSLAQKVPMRWIKGDTAPHRDMDMHRSQGQHNINYILYLSDNPGEFVVGRSTFPILKNTALAFDERRIHKTINTASEPRLMLGPINSPRILKRELEVSVILDGNNAVAEIIGDESTIYITQQMIDACSGIYTLSDNANRETDYEISGNLVIPASKYFAVAPSADIFISGAGYSITIIPDSGITSYGGLFDSSAGTLYVESLTIKSQGVSLDSSAGWFFRYKSGAQCVANLCNSTGVINGAGSGGIFGADISFDIYVEGSMGPQRVNNGANYCFSTGNITGAGAGGIIGANTDSGIIKTCYSWGAISGLGAGGLFGADSSGSTVNNSYSSGTVSAGMGGICGVRSTLSSGSSNVYAAGARGATGAFVAGSDASGSLFVWNSNWKDVDVSGILILKSVGGGTGTGTAIIDPDAPGKIPDYIFNLGNSILSINRRTDDPLFGDDLAYFTDGMTTQPWYSWAPNTPYRLIAPISASSKSTEVRAFISQLTDTTTTTVNMLSLNLTPRPNKETKEVTFVPTGSTANVSAGATVYLIGTAGTTSTITLNGVRLTIVFKNNCEFSFNGGADVSSPADVTVGGLTFSLIACGSALITIVSTSGFTPCDTEKYLNNDYRVETVRGNALVRDVKSQPNLQFKTYADYIAYRKSAQRGCCC